LEEVATVYRVHRATGARWIAQARAALLERLGAELRRRLRADTREVASLVRLLESQLDVTLSRLLAFEPESTE
ncbi:MAG TPA: transcriptional regulator, partial [Dehalococcoidia bacterium]|nr:transcriptional regulator [Dehalococcoidia bacterium]